HSLGSGVPGRFGGSFSSNPRRRSARRVLHRDISVNNILVAVNQLALVDWEIGRRFQEPLSATGRGTITGTLDTMSVASLANRDPLPHDDIESAVYV
ncbi:hypothetical protein B0H14DRAFT_3053390, partial [Mycena olivaceomarginata]